MDKFFFSKLFGDIHSTNLNSNEDSSDEMNDLRKDPEQHKFDDFFFGSLHNFGDGHSNIFKEMEGLFQNMFSASFGSLDHPNFDHSFSSDDNPRKFMLKDSDDAWKFPENHSVPFHNILENQDMRDTDIDEKVAEKGLFASKEFYNKPNPSTYSFKKFTSVRTVYLPDGTIEEQKTFTDQNGEKMTKVTRTIGEQTHQVIVHSDGKKIQEKEENFINMDDGNFLDFERKWQHLKDNNFQMPAKHLEIKQDASKELFVPPGDSKYLSLFKKCFGVSP